LGAEQNGTDHVVRSAVAEVRKRLAQYYQENGRGQVRIEVLPGTYVPQFRWASEELSSASIKMQLPAGTPRK
jgi:hypothetical protein